MTDPKIIELAQLLTDEQWALVFEWELNYSSSDTAVDKELLAYVRELADKEVSAHITYVDAVAFGLCTTEGLTTPLGRAVLRELERMRG